MTDHVEEMTESTKKFSFKDLDLDAAEFVPTFVPSQPVQPTAPKAEIKKVEKVEKQEKPVVQRSDTSESTKKPETPVEDEPDGGKDHVNIVFIGHVDAGKSTLGGHILYLTGMVDKRTLEKYEREAKEMGRDSWYLSWALDNYSEERAKGKTVEYGRGYFETELRKYTILDAPGHKTYVPSMIGGASQADYAVLVISARKGEFETGFERGGQTREHAMLVKTAGVKKLVLVINKMDDPTVEWSKERYDEIIGKMLPFLKSCGFNPKTDILPVPLSGYTGANIKDPLAKGVADWWTGKSLLQTLDDLPLPDDRKAGGYLIMPISDKFKDMGTVAMGKIEAGKVRKGQQVLVMPNRKLAEVTTIWIEETELNSAKVGENVRLRLKGVEEEDCVSGYVICDPQHPVHATTTFEAQLQIIEWKSIIAPGFQAVCHFHSGTEEVSMTDLLHMVDKKTGKKSKHPPKFVKQGDACIVRLECAQPICLETYANQPQLGRFTIRDEAKTVAIGKVTKVLEGASTASAAE